MGRISPFSRGATSGHGWTARRSLLALSLYLGLMFSCLEYFVPFTRAEWNGPNNTTSAFHDQPPADQIDQSLANTSGISLEQLPSLDVCWYALIDVLQWDASSQGQGANDVVAFQLLGCRPEAEDAERCCTFFMNFGLGTQAAGCLCVENFLQSLGPSILGPLLSELGVDVDPYAWTEKCPQLGYELPVVGNQYCPAVQEVDCTSPHTDPEEGKALLQLQRNESALEPAWSMDTNVCCWAGVSCDPDGHVMAFELLDSSAGLHGTLPPSLSQLTALTTLVFPKGGNLTGTLPSSWSTLTKLEHINVISNHLTGTLPPEYSELGALKYMLLAENELTGTLPPGYSTFQSPVINLQMAYNELTGPLPGSWSQITGAVVLDLGVNQISGPLPPEWGSMRKLQSLSLGGNVHLGGTLPSEWSTLESISQLSLSAGSVTGTLPPSWSTMSQVEYLWLGYQKLTGSLPTQWSALTLLHHINLKSNLLTGTIPSEWTALPISTLHMSDNWLSGPMPLDFGTSSEEDVVDESTQQELSMQLNYFDDMPEGLVFASAEYNCLPHADSQRFCPRNSIVAIMLGLLLAACLVSVVTHALTRGWHEFLLDAKFVWLRAVRTRMGSLMGPNTLLTAATVCAMLQRLFVLSWTFSFRTMPWVVALVRATLGHPPAEVVRFIGGSVGSLVQVAPLAYFLCGFVFRIVLSITGAPDWLPGIGSNRAWTVVASQDVLRNNLSAIQLHQLVLLVVYGFSSALVAAVLYLGMPNSLESTTVSDYIQLGFNTKGEDNSVEVPRTMFTLVGVSYVVMFYSIVATVSLPGSILKSSSAINEAIKAGSSSSTVARLELRQLRWLRLSLIQGCISIVLFGGSLARCIRSMNELDTRLIAGWDPSTTVALLLSAQLLSVTCWNIGIHQARLLGKDGSLDRPVLFPMLSLRGIRRTVTHTLQKSRFTLPSGSTQWRNQETPAAEGNLIRTTSAWGEKPSSPTSPQQQSPGRSLGASCLKLGSLAWLGGVLRPRVSVVGRTQAQATALQLVMAMQMVHIGGAAGGQALAWAAWVVSLVILSWALLVQDSPAEFDDIHDSAAFGMVILARDLAVAIQKDLAADGDDITLSGTQSCHVPTCCANAPAGCDSCQRILRRFPASMFRMEETLCISYRWQQNIRAIVRPPSFPPFTEINGMKRRVVGINMSRWQREQLLDAILRTRCTYVWLDVLSIPAALKPVAGTRLAELSEKLMTRMMAVYAAASSTLAMLSDEDEGGRYCQRAWTMQEYCGARALDVVCQSTPDLKKPGNQKRKVAGTTFKNLYSTLTNFASRFAPMAFSYEAEEMERYMDLRRFVEGSTRSAVPLWIRAIQGKADEIDELDTRADLYASVMDKVGCQQPEDLVRALVPVLLNTSVQNKDELRTLVRVASLKSAPGSAGSAALQRAETLLKDADGEDHMP